MSIDFTSVDPFKGLGKDGFIVDVLTHVDIYLRNVIKGNSGEAMESYLHLQSLGFSLTLTDHRLFGLEFDEPQPSNPDT